MKFKAIMFDLDGTLLPMDNDVFMKGYFKELAGKLGQFGMSSDLLIEAVWAGTKAMVKNDGTEKNVEVFWKTFASYGNVDPAPYREASDEFYVNEFHRVKAYTNENPLAPETIRLAHQCAEKVVCSSNPLFPLTGQCSRLSWIGLCHDDFDLITSYESDSYCKPNPAYFLSVCERIGAEPSECLLIGNDEGEDMYAATAAGLQCYLVTDHMIEREDHPWNGKKGTYEEMVAYLRELADE